MSWVTINGAHVLIGDDGTIEQGPKELVGSKVAADKEHYHGTSEKNVQSILKNGIRATDATSGIKSAYVSTGKDLAFSYGVGEAAKQGDKNVAIVVLKSGKQAGLYNPKGKDNIAYYPGTIKPEHIDRVEIYRSNAGKNEKPLRIIKPPHFAEEVSMSALNGQWIEAFRAGDYGPKGAYTAADIDAMIANYDPAKHEAPVVLGHPETDAPAYGWVEALKRDGDVMLAKLKQVQPEFEGLVRSGKFKKRSISFYRNPQLELRHLGFLGAMPPGVKGMADVKMHAFRDGAHQEVEFKEEQSMTIEEIRTAFSEAVEKIMAKFKTNDTKSFSEEDVKKMLGETEKKFSDELGKVVTTLREHEKLADAAAKKAAEAGRSSLADTTIEKLKAEKKYINAFDKMGVPQIFTELAKSEVKVSFGEGDKKVEKPMVEVFADFFRGIQEIVPVKEIAAGAAKAGKVLNFNESKGIALAEGSVQLKEVAEKIMAEKKISFGEALKIARSENPELVQVGNGTSGQV